MRGPKPCVARRHRPAAELRAHRARLLLLNYMFIVIYVYLFRCFMCILFMLLLLRGSSFV